MNTISYRIIFALCIGMAWVSLALARYGGPGYLMNAAATGAPGEITCTACHNGGSGAGSLQLDVIQGPNVYTPGATYQLRASLNAPGSLTGGIQLVALHNDSSVGSWIGTNGMRSVQVSSFNNPVREYLEHSNPRIADNQGLTTWEFSWKAPATQGLSPMFYAASVAANDDFTPGGDRVYQTFLSFASLPVRWGDLRLEQQRGGVELTWETKEEINNDRFEIQRSLDGHIFTPLGSIPAKGNTSSDQRYSWQDQAPIYRQEIFYRIKQVDLNGRFSFSEIQQIRLDRVEVGVSSCYPNLIKRGEYIRFSYTSEQDAMLEIMIQSMDGKSLRVDTYNLHEGMSGGEIATNSLQTGRYSLIFKQGKFAEVWTVLVY